MPNTETQQQLQEICSCDQESWDLFCEYTSTEPEQLVVQPDDLSDIDIWISRSIIFPNPSDREI